MNLFILDTDILTLFQRDNATILARVAQHSPSEIAISVVTVEEQPSGWYTQIRKAKRPQELTWAYRRLAANVRFLSRVQILDYEEKTNEWYHALKRLRLRVGKMDLQIAATALEHGGTVVTRNIRDFKAVPGLMVEDWSV